MDPISSALLGKMLGFGFDNYLQPLLKQASASVDKLSELIRDESERRRMSLFRSALLHLELRHEEGHLNKARDLLIEAIAMDRYACAPRLLHGLLLCENDQTALLGRGHIEAALRINPFALHQIGEAMDIHSPTTASTLALKASPVPLNGSWTVDLATLPVLAKRRTAFLPSVAKKAWNRFSASSAWTQYNSQSLVLGAAVHGDAVFASWKLSHNLKKEGDHLLGKIVEAKAVWLVPDTSERPLLAGEEVLLSIESGKGAVVGRESATGEELFRVSPPYADAMITMGLRISVSVPGQLGSRMTSRDVSDFVQLMSAQADFEGVLVVDPGYGHAVGKAEMVEEFPLLSADGIYYLIKNTVEHWHQPALGTQLGSCMITGSGTISRLTPALRSD